MDKKCQYIIRGIKRYHIILKFTRIYGNMLSCNHSDNRLTQSVHIYFDIHLQGFKGFGFCPIAVKNAVDNCSYNRLRIVNIIATHFISIVPLCHFFKRHIIFIAKISNIIGGKSCVFRKHCLISHRIFRIHIESGMLAVFFYGKNARCIVKCHIWLFLEQSPEIIKIQLLSFRIIPINSENTVPFVNYKNKGYACCLINFKQHFIRGIIIG